MKLHRKFSFLLAPILVASVVFAQTGDEDAADGASGSYEISAARSHYIAAISPDAKPDATDDHTLAQFPRTRSGMQFPHQHGYPRRDYQTPWMDHGSAGHVLIGAAIGFGIGAALGARNSAQNGTPVSGGIIIGGGLFGLIGGCVGGAIGSFSAGPYPFARRRRYRRSSSWDEDDEETAVPSNPNGSHRERSLSAKPASPRPPARSVATSRAATLPPDSNLSNDFGKPGTLTAVIRISR